MDFLGKKIYFLDMDGTIYHETKIIDGALEFFNECNKQGIQYVFLTNNSSKNNITYYNKLTKMGIPCTLNDFYSSIDATIFYIKEKGYKDVYLVGTTDFYNVLKEHVNVHIGAYYEHVDAVVIGFDTELNYEKLRCASFHLENGVDYIATNPDFRCPIEDGRYIPDCGTLIYMFLKTTERSPFVIGKPRPFMIEAVLKERGLKKEDAVMIGDRIYTDIMCGLNAGVDSILVMSGETDSKILEESKEKPTLTLDSIKDVYTIIKR